MHILQLTPLDVEAVMTQLKQGKTYAAVAADLGISLEMVVCAARKGKNVRPFFMWSLG